MIEVSPPDADLGPFFERSIDLLAVTDLDGTFLRLNGRWTDLLGFAREEILGRPYLEFVHPDDRDRIAVEAAALRTSGSPSGFFDNRYRTKDGRYRSIHWSCSIDRAAGRIYATGRDVTDARQATERFQSVVEAAPNGLITVDHHGRVVLVNRRIEQLFGYGRAEIVGQPIETLLPERYRGGHVGTRERYLAAPSDRRMGAGRDLYGRRKDGTEFPIEIGLSPLATPDGTYVHCSIVDVSERKRHESELRERVHDLQRHRRETELLGEMSSLLQHAVSEREALDIVTAFGQRLFAQAKGGIYILPASGDGLDLLASWGSFVGRERLETSACWALRRSQPHRNTPESAARCPHVLDASGKLSGRTTCIPMSAHGHSLGMLTLSFAEAGAEQQWEQPEQLGKAVADQFGLALTNLQLRDRLRNLSIRDGLTGLFNRRYLEETVVRELHRAARNGRPLGVVMLDVDHFKLFNDRHGHQAADDVLREVARVLSAGTRKEDVACRFGGEEFVVLLPDATLENAAMRAETLRAAVHERTGRKVTLSAGVASYPLHGESWEVLLRTADSALYRAKSEGRNRVVASASLAPASTPILPRVPSSPPAE